MILYDLPAMFVLPYLFVFGAVVGSFLNVCIYRFPENEDLRNQLRGLLWPPSRCPKCHNFISRFDNVPIFGWLKLRGRCRFCSVRISPRYPLIELFNGLLFVLVYWLEVPFDRGATLHESCLFTPLLADGENIFSWLSPVAIVNWRYVYHLVLIDALVVATFIDFDHKIIPDGSTLPAMLIGVLGGTVFGTMSLVPIWYQDPSMMRTLRIAAPEWLQPLITDSMVPGWVAGHPHWHGLAVSLAGIVVGGGMVWVVRLIGSRVLKREAMGFGDVILMGMIGSFIGWQPVVVAFFLAPVFALLAVAAMFLFRRQQEIPYGPYLSIATVVAILGWKGIWPNIDHFFGLGPLLPVVAVVMAVMLYATLLFMQLGKRLLGIPLYPSDWVVEWTSADQLHHFAGEHVDPYQGQWRSRQEEEWGGLASGRGTGYEHQWRHGSSTGSGHRQSHSR